MNGPPAAGIRSRIAAYVIDQIRSGAWMPGTQLPSESQFMAILGASRMTVHHALRELTAQGWLVRRKGSGTFVAPAQTYASHYGHRDIRQEIGASGAAYSARVVAQESRAAGEDMAGIFSCEAQTPLFHAVIVHCADGRPVELEERHVNPQVLPEFPNLDLTHRTLFSCLMLSHPSREGVETIGVMLCDRREQTLLECDGATPAMEIIRCSWTDEEVVTHARLVRVGTMAYLSGDIGRR
jgi:GntR family histidine utilization transcriptional repressor